jgi:hypothetical protein
MAAVFPLIPPSRVQDVLGGFDYGRWYLQPIGSIPFGTAVLGATNVFPAVTVAGVAYPGIPILETGILRVIVGITVAQTFSLQLTRGFPAAPVAIVQAYNSKSVAGVDVVAPLAVNGLYLFDVPVQAGDVVNWQFGGGTTINILDAYMILMMGP